MSATITRIFGRGVTDPKVKRAKSRAAIKRMGSDEMKNWLTCGAIWLIIAAGLLVAGFGHVRTLGIYAGFAIPVNIGAAVLCARFAMRMGEAPHFIKRAAIFLLMIGCTVITAVSEHRGFHAGSAYLESGYNEAQHARTTAQATVSTLEAEWKALPHLPTDAAQLATYPTRAADRIERGEDEWKAHNQARLDAGRNILGSPEPVQWAPPLSDAMINGIVIFMICLHLFAFWSISPGAGIVLSFPSFKKKRPPSPSENGRNLAAARWNKR